MNRRLIAALLVFAAMSLACGQVTELLSSAQELQDAGATLEAAAPTLEALAPTLEAAATSGQIGQVGPTGAELRQWAASASATSQYGSDSWSALQVTGAPDTYPECGDIGTAWASEFSNGVDSLTVSYQNAVVPRQILIYQTYNPGAIVSVFAFGAGMQTAQVYSAQPQVLDPSACPNILTIDVTNVDFPVESLQIDLDQSNHSSWNEIDAVELVGNLP